MSGSQTVFIPKKGSRDYIQGCDIQKACVSFLRDCSVGVHSYRCEFKSIINGCSVSLKLINSRSEVAKHEFDAIFIGSSDRGEHIVIVQSLQDSRSECVSFDEKHLVESAFFDAKTASLKYADSSYHVTEYFVALNKLLCSRAVTPEKMKDLKWLHVKSEILDVRPFELGAELTLSLDVFTSSNTAKSSMSVDGKHFGYIVFIGVQNHVD